MGNASMQQRIAELKAAEMEKLRRHYSELFNEQPKTTNRCHLIRRIAWQLQARELGDISEAAIQHAMGLADESLLKGRIEENEAGLRRRRKPRVDSRLPGQGTELVRIYENRTIVARVLPGGFEYEGRRYRSLSAIARVVTGTRWNGLVFFGVAKRGETPKHRQKRSRLKESEHAG